MPRGPRIDFPGAVHHVYARGIEKRDIYLDDFDRDNFLGRVGVNLAKWDVRCSAWTLMPNHFHLLIQSDRGCLPSFMHCLLTGYSRYFNQRHNRVGHLFQNRYKSPIVSNMAFRDVVRHHGRAVHPSQSAAFGNRTLGRCLGGLSLDRSPADRAGRTPGVAGHRTSAGGIPRVLRGIGMDSQLSRIPGSRARRGCRRSRAGGYRRAGGIRGSPADGCDGASPDVFRTPESHRGVHGVPVDGCILRGTGITWWSRCGKRC